MKQRIDHSNRQSRSATDLHSDSKTVRYEFENLLGIALAYCPNWRRDDPIRNNAYIEAFALHFRALLFFLYGHLNEITAGAKTEQFGRPFDTDVFAIDYDKSWNSHCPSPVEVLVTAKWQADKHVAHITTVRRDVNQIGSMKESVWRLKDAASAICDVVEVFLRQVPQQNFNPDELQKMKELVTNWQSRNQSQALSCSVSTPGLQSLPGVTGTDKSSIQPNWSIHGKTA